MTRMQQRRDTAANWTAANPVLASGEIGVETDTGEWKLGNGTSSWTALGYQVAPADLAGVLADLEDKADTLDVAALEEDVTAHAAELAGRLSAGSLSATIARGRTAILYAKDYGVVTDGTDSTDALQAAIDDLPQTGTNWGGVIELPSGTITLAGHLNLEQKENVTIVGQAAMGRSYTPTTLKFTRADSSPCIRLGSCNSVKIAQMRIETSSSAYSGNVISTAAVAVADAQMVMLEDVNMRAAGTGATLVSLLHAVGAVIRRCHFSGGAIAVRGNGDTTGTAIAQSYSIAITIDSQCQFGNQATASIYNPSYDWNITGNIFSPGPGGIANAISGDMGALARGLVIQGNYFGDAGASGTYVKIAAQGAIVSGNYFDGDNCIGLFIKRPSYAVVVEANDMRLGGTGVAVDCDPDTGASPSLGIRVGPNYWSTSATKIQNHTNTNMRVALLGNPGTADLNPWAPEFSQGFTVGGGSGTSFASNGDITMQLNRAFKGYRLTDTAGSQVSVYLGAIAGHGLTARSDVATRTPVVARAHASQSVDVFKAEDSAGTAHFRVTKDGAAVVKSFATGSRPSASTVGAGGHIFDTTLGKPVWSNGTAWVDATGATA